jgi:predicted acyltransferase
MLCGQLLLAGGYSHWKKLGILIVAAGICLGLGILADMSVCPIVKRIWTPSWVLFSGGYVIGMLALFYLLFDIAPLKFLAFPLVVVGMNSILTYLLGQTLGGWTRESFIGVHFAGLIEATFGPRALDPEWYAPITLATGTFVVFWLFLYWLHRQKIYLRL